MAGIIICTFVVFGAFFVAISAGGAAAVTGAALFLGKGPAPAGAKPEGEAAK